MQIQEKKDKQQNKLSKNWNHKFQRKKVLNNSNNSNIRHKQFQHQNLFENFQIQSLISL
jgi:hypothetical protein